MCVYIYIYILQFINNIFLAKCSPETEMKRVKGGGGTSTY